MKLSGKADLIFLAIIAATALVKIVSSRPEVPPSNRAFIHALTAALKPSGLSVRVEADPSGDVVFAAGQSCRMWARDYAPYGTSLAFYRSQAVPYGPLVFVYRGQLYRQPPKLEPLLRFYLGRELARLGLQATRPPIVVVAASPQCPVAAVDWDIVREVAW